MRGTRPTVRCVPSTAWQIVHEGHQPPLKISSFGLSLVLLEPSSYLSQHQHIAIMSDDKIPESNVDVQVYVIIAIYASPH
jgi:hypothetical protein